LHSEEEFLLGDLLSMRIRTGLIAFPMLCILLLIPLVSFAQERGAVTASAYFGLGPEQQQIHIERFLDANEELKNECVPDITAHEFHRYFNDWLEKHPGFFSRSVQLAFSTATIDKCIESG